VRGLKGRLQSKLNGAVQRYKQAQKIMSLSKDKPRERLALDRLKIMVNKVKDFKPMIAMYLLLTKTGGV
jgi:hypothetical protein